MEVNETWEAILPKGGVRKPGYAGRRAVKPLNKAGLVIKITLAALVLLTIYGFISFDYKNIVFFQALAATVDNFGIVFFQPRFNHFSVLDAVRQLGVTLSLAFLTTIFGAIFSLVLGLLAAQNLSTKIISNAVKSFVAFIRAVPTVLWVLIFAIAAGLGSTATVIGLTFHSVGYLVKAYSESFEEMDKGVLEALKASGANWWQVVFQAVIPSSATYLLSWTFLRFEINFMNAVAMGAAAGAGGIGFDLFWASAYYFDLREVGLITYFILAVAIVLETTSTRAKNKLQARNS